MAAAALNALFPLADDTTPYRKLDVDGVDTSRFNGQTLVTVTPQALRALSKQAFIDINHLLRPGHLQQLAAILKDRRRPRTTGSWPTTC